MGKMLVLLAIALGACAIGRESPAYSPYADARSPAAVFVGGGGGGGSGGGM